MDMLKYLHFIEIMVQDIIHHSKFLMIPRKHMVIRGTRVCCSLVSSYLKIIANIMQYIYGRKLAAHLHEKDKMYVQQYVSKSIFKSCNKLTGNITGAHTKNEK